MNKPRLGFVGTGRVGTALAVGLRDAGYPVAAGWSRSTPALDGFTSLVSEAKPVSRPLEVVEASDVVFLTVPDSLIDVLAQSLSWDASRTAIHCSGTLSLEVLAPAAAEGAAIGSLHPLLPVASARAELKGATAAIEGDGRALPLVRQMVDALDMRAVVLEPGQKPLYHAAAVLLSNYSVTLFAAASDLLQSLGLDEEESRSALLPLLQGVVSNLASDEPARALTGPIARGDVETVQGHLRALEESRPEAVGLYRELGRQTVAMARRQDVIDESTAARLNRVLAIDQTEEVPA